MASLTVRNLSPEIVDALKKRAAAHGHSAEAEHREILTTALLHARRRSFVDVLRSMPNVGDDQDFERLQDDGDTPDVFG